MNRRRPQIKIQAFLANLPMFSEMSTDELDQQLEAAVGALRRSTPEPTAPWRHHRKPCRALP